MEGRELRKWTLCSFSLHAVTHLTPFTRLNLVSWVDGALCFKANPREDFLKAGPASMQYSICARRCRSTTASAQRRIRTAPPWIHFFKSTNKNNQLRGCAQVHIFSKSLSGGELQVLRLLLTFWSILKLISFIARYFKILSTWFAYATSFPGSEGTICFSFRIKPL